MINGNPIIFQLRHLQFPPLQLRSDIVIYNRADLGTLNPTPICPLPSLRPFIMLINIRGTQSHNSDSSFSRVVVAQGNHASFFWWWQRSVLVSVASLSLSLSGHNLLHSFFPAFCICAFCYPKSFL